MLDSLRNMASGWIAQILLAILVLSFAVWGVADIFTGFGQNAVARVGSADITVREFQRRYQVASQNVLQQIGQNLTPQQLQANGSRLWGPLAVAANSTESVDWDRSAALFVGRQALIDEVKGDGHFSLYVVANGAFNVTVTKGTLIVVVGAAV